MQRGRTGTGRL